MYTHHQDQIMIVLCHEKLLFVYKVFLAEGKLEEVGDPYEGKVRRTILQNHHVIAIFVVSYWGWMCIMYETDSI